MKSAILPRECETFLRLRKNVRIGLVSLKSSRSVDGTVRRVEDLLTVKDVELFSVDDQVERAGLRLPHTKLLIFGHPKTGTPSMIVAPSVTGD